MATENTTARIQLINNINDITYSVINGTVSVSAPVYFTDTTPLGNVSGIYVIQPDDKAIIYNEEGFTGTFSTLIRINPDGTIDDSFDGILSYTIRILDIMENDNIIVVDEYYFYILNPDGSILSQDDFEDNYSIFFNKLIDGKYINCDGNNIRKYIDVGSILDTTYGWENNGLVRNLTNTFNSIVKQSDDKLLFSLSATASILAKGGTFSKGPGVYRLNTDGSFDNTFVYGSVYRPLSPSDSLIEGNPVLKIDNNGKCMVNVYKGNFDYLMIRLNTDGSVDTSYNFDNYLPYPSTILFQSDNKMILFGGQFYDDRPWSRFNTDGSIDTTFNTSELVTIQYNGDLQSIKNYSNGDMLYLGNAGFNWPSGNNNITRLNRNGNEVLTVDIDTNQPIIVNTPTTNNSVNGYLDLSDNTVLPITFSISEIRDLSKRKGIFTKSITIPGTKNNNELLNYYFDANIIANTFDINKLQYCNVIQNDIPILNNVVIQLISINKEQQNSYYEDSITYTLLIKDTTADFFSVINNKYLSDINLDYLDHNRFASDIITSFGNTVEDGYKYVMPFSPSVTAVPRFNLNEFSPAVYTKVYFDKIFSDAGFRYTWPGMTASDIQFDKLIIPYNGDEPPLNFINDGTLIDFTVPLSFPSSSPYATTSLDLATDIFSVIDSGTGFVGLNYVIEFAFGPLKDPLTGTLLDTTDFRLVIRDQNDNYITELPPYNISGGIQQNDFLYLIPSSLTPLTRQFKFYLKAPVDYTYVAFNFRFRIQAVERSQSLGNPGNPLGYNKLINMNNFIPEKVKQSDFIKSIFTMFNLYCETDQENSNTLIIKNRDKYYDEGKIVDWTEKLVKDKPQEIKFLPELSNKKLMLTYKEDEDVANTTYKDATGDIYGELEYTFDNEFVKDTTTQEIIFSPTPTSNAAFGAILPRLSSGYPKCNIRILIDGGTYSCGTYSIISTPTISTTSRVYPHINHFDKPNNPTFDINFGVCKYYFRTDNFIKTNNNLFNLHWRRTLNQINTGKLLTAFFNLNETDMFNLKLSDKIRIDNGWWNINKIQDYNANSNSPTKVELISIDDELSIDYISSEPIQLTRASKLISNVNNKMTNEILRVKNVNLSDIDIQFSGIDNIVYEGVHNAIVQGSNNTISQDTIVFGDNNIVDSKSFVYGNNVTVEIGVTNSFVVGDNITATQSDTLYTNNIILASGSTINNQPITNIVGLWEADTVNIGVINAISGYDTLVGGSAGTSVDVTTTDSIAWGNNVEISGAYSAAFGLDTLASDNAIVAGDGCNAGPYSAAFGQFTIAGQFSMAVGNGNSATGDASFTSGESNGSIGDFSSSIGYYNTANSIGEVVIGHFSENLAGTPTSIDPDDTIFRVGIGTATATRLDGFRVYKNSAIKLNPVEEVSITTPENGMIILDNEDGNTRIKVYNSNDSQWDTYMKMPIQASGNDIYFNRPQIYGSSTTPITGDLLQPGAGFDYIGIVQKIYHQQGTAPTFPAGWVLLSGAYSTTLLNIIYAEWCSLTRVEYRIISI